MAREEYRYLIDNLAGLVRIIEKTIHYKPWYATGVVSERFRDCPLEHDRRMIKLYDTAAPKWDTWRRKKQGMARYKYLRFENTWWLFASSGERSLMEERNQVHHIRDVPIKFEGYSIRLRQGGFERRSREERIRVNREWDTYKEAKARGKHAAKPARAKRHQRQVASVRIERGALEGLEMEVVKLARKGKRHQVATWFFQLEFSPYRPVYEQQKTILRKVNKVLGARGIEKLPTSIIRWKRENTQAYARIETV
ncbi:hypothetical protein [Bythopirellula goksoeyrii]|uniref:Uncharacterized protein n=1 Tax=Bythopirellula goksoeyrii TaxID=1400387 RepID=A0A5B9QAG9_9BACT|nr:hypothetical protein [Bythopirellula goksoeyrii]QEG36074.1 hypothetical protein Pr1d_33830 [Bythopirellula goksoeyrii]